MLVSSRLLEYEAWSWINALGLARSHRVVLEAALARIAFIELSRPVLGQATEPFPTPVRTLDAIHLASIEFVRGLGQDLSLASYDQRMIKAARALGVPLATQ